MHVNTESISLCKSALNARRHRQEWRFRLYGIIAIFISLFFLGFMLLSLSWQGLPVLRQSKIGVPINVSAHYPLAENASATDLQNLDYRLLLRKSLQNKFPDATSRREKRDLSNLLNIAANDDLRKKIMANPALAQEETVFWFVASTDADLYLRGKYDKDLDTSLWRLRPHQINWLESLRAEQLVVQAFNTNFFFHADSREPELAGILGALLGSFFSLLVCFVISFPMGILTAIYLQEFAPKSWWVALIEININNLAAVPSIVFGLLGLSVFLGVFHLPRSTPLVGGLVLALMTLPTIIIASRASLRSVPASIRDAALGLGATRVQTTFHHILPAAMPGMLTGSIIGMAQALGETAPLLMIGMVAFIVDIPAGIVDQATSLPVQIFLWADSPEKGFVERTSAAILVLLVFLILINIVAIVLRKRFERRW